MRLLLGSLLLVAALPCRFTVRDVAFVDLGDTDYALHVFVSDEETPKAKAVLDRLARAQLSDVNVAVDFLDPDAEEEQPAHRHLREQQIQKFPTMVLVHPDGRAVELPFPGEFETVASGTIESVASSPLRRRIRDQALARYCVVLLLEGPDATANTRAATAVSEAFAILERGFDKMPKAVGDLPKLLRVSPGERAKESLLLWSLGVEVAADAPSVVVLLGRGRRFGPILDGAAIDKQSVLGILANAGESCECDLDRSWMRGPRIPLRWDADVRQRATELLGFDPDNPVVKSEVSGILSKRAKGRRGRDDATPSVAELLARYSEAPVDGAGGAESASPEGRVPTPEAPESNLFLPVVLTLGMLLLFSVTAAGLMLLRRPKVQSK